MKCIDNSRSPRANSLAHLDTGWLAYRISATPALWTLACNVWATPTKSLVTSLTIDLLRISTKKTDWDQVKRLKERERELEFKGNFSFYLFNKKYLIRDFEKYNIALYEILKIKTKLFIMFIFGELIGGRLASAYGELMKELWHGSDRYVSPWDIKKIIAEKAS